MPDRPDWLTLPVPPAESLDRMKKLLDAGRLHTVCEGADCPNIGECFSCKTCTFMILGDKCTRNCRFCAVEHSRPEPLDPDEPIEVALTSRQLGLRHVVVTSVTRDDLPDGGAAHFAATIRAIRQFVPEAAVEVLIPDFQGDAESLKTVLEAKPDVLNHNIETVPRLYFRVRPQASYARSLKLLHRAHSKGAILTKSGMMLGLGETLEEVETTMSDLHRAGCDILTLGQYLQPTSRHVPVVDYIHPRIFAMLASKAYEMGFLEVNAGPLVRSSYHAAGSLDGLKKKQWLKGGNSFGSD